MISSAADKLLMHYAAGRLHPAEALVVAAHLALRPAARGKVAAYEALGAKMMCADHGAPVSAACLEKVMQRIETPAAPEPAPASPCAETARRLNIPVAVYALLTDCCTKPRLQWRPLMRGLETIDLQAASATPHAGRRLMLMKAAPDATVPRHRHSGQEITLVLHGSFSDETGNYQAGDLQVIDDPDLVHRPVAGKDGCVCLLMHEQHGLFRQMWLFVGAFLR